MERDPAGVAPVLGAGRQRGVVVPANSGGGSHSDKSHSPRGAAAAGRADFVTNLTTAHDAGEENFVLNEASNYASDSDSVEGGRAEDEGGASWEFYRSDDDDDDDDDDADDDLSSGSVDLDTSCDESDEDNSHFVGQERGCASCAVQGLRLGSSSSGDSGGLVGLMSSTPPTQGLVVGMDYQRSTRRVISVPRGMYANAGSDRQRRQRTGTGCHTSSSAPNGSLGVSSAPRRVKRRKSRRRINYSSDLQTANGNLRDENSQLKAILEKLESAHNSGDFSGL